MLRSLYSDRTDRDGRLISPLPKGARPGQPKDEKDLSPGELRYVEKAKREAYERQLMTKVEREFLLGNNSIGAIAKKLDEPEHEVSSAVTILAQQSASAVSRGKVRS